MGSSIVRALLSSFRVPFFYAQQQGKLKFLCLAEACPSGVVIGTSTLYVDFTPFQEVVDEKLKKFTPILYPASNVSTCEFFTV